MPRTPATRNIVIPPRLSVAPRLGLLRRRAQDVSTNTALPQVATKTVKLTKMQLRYLAARTAVDILEAHDFPCAIFGSMACKLYGNDRIPNVSMPFSSSHNANPAFGFQDIDILVLPPATSQPPLATQEVLKDILVAASPTQFTLKPPRDPMAPYRILYFLPSPPSTHKPLKVDIVLPGVMHLPALPPAKLKWLSPGDAEPISKLPALPFPVVLLQKLQAWDDHRRSEEERYTKKVPMDVADLEWMLRVGVGRYLKDGEEQWHGTWSDREMFSEEFEQLSKGRVGAFCEIHPKWSGTWKGLGFEQP